MSHARLVRHPDHFQGRFSAMACDCVLLMRTADPALADSLLRAAEARTRAIEAKFSRYITGNLCDRINRSQGKPVPIDEETHRLLLFADTCYRLSEGLFDLTSGVLRRAWQFDGSDRLPTPEQIRPLLAQIGWERVQWNAQWVILPEGMELDFGGIGKEYAVDCVVALMAELAPDTPVLVNFGGDLALSQPVDLPWRVGITPASKDAPSPALLTLTNGALATSGDTQRFLLHNGVRYSHLLNPKTGWATHGGPRQMTVAGKTCLQAGLLSTLALLHGPDAEAFIQAQQVPYWITD